MIRIQVDILPDGSISAKQPVCEIEIANQHKDCEKCQYECRIYDEKTGGATYMIWHNRKEGIYVLLEKCLKKYNEGEHSHTMRVRQGLLE